MSEKIINGEVSNEPASQTEQENKSKYFPLTKRDTTFAVLFALVAVLFSGLGLFGGFRIGYTVSAIFGWLVLTVYLWNKNTKIKFFPLLCGILSLALPTVFLITSNGSVRFWSLTAVPLLAMAWFASLVDYGDFGGDLELVRNFAHQIFLGMFGKLPKTFTSLFAAKSERKSRVGKALLGILLAVPVLMIVIPLLISSDVAFAGFVKSFFENITLTVFKVIVGLIITPFLISYCFALKNSEKHIATPTKFRGVDNVIVISFLSALSVCYLTYLFSQLAYFFSAFNGFLPEGYKFNVSSYARRGFFEMSAIATINLIIIFGALLLSRKKNGKICITSRLVCLFISVFTLIIIATAISKMVLYIRELGMTRLRITTSAFMIFLAIVFLSVILRLFISKIKVLRTALVTAGMVLLVLGAVNVNHVVAAYNYYAYENNMLKTIDVETIYNLGDEGIPYLAKLMNDDDIDDVNVVVSARNYLEQAIEYTYYDTDYDYETRTHTIYGKRYDKLENFGIYRMKAYEVLGEFIEEHPDMYKIEK